MLTLLKRSKAFALWVMALAIHFFALPVSAQKKLPDVIITIDARDLALTDVLEVISQKSGIPFSYNPKRIAANQKISIEAVNKTLGFILNELAERFGLSYTFMEDQIILKPDKKSEKPDVRTITLSGYVKDASTGEALIGSTLFLRELNAGTVCNAFGFYSITIPKGIYTMECSFIGYKAQISSLDLSSSLTQDINLREEPPLLKEIIVQASTEVTGQEIQASSTDLRPSMVEQRPSLFGEVDVVKSLESVPGIKLHSEGSTFYYVRGGNRDQNMILVDDAQIYNPSHMLGFFSTIIPDAVNDMTLYKGDMPASLGGRLSSVLDVRTKKGNDQHRQAWGNIGLISTKLGIEGPIKKEKSSFLVSARVSRLKWLAQLADKSITKFNFYDFTGKVNFKLDARNKIFFSFYTGADNYFNTSRGIAWTNTAATFRWNHLITDRLFLNTTLAGSSYDYFLYTDVAKSTRWNSHISNINLKADFSYFIKPQNEFNFGMGVNGYNFNPGNLQSSQPIPSSVSPLSIRNSAEFVLYGNHEVKFNQHWGLNYGLRLSSWTNTGEAFEFVYDQNKNPIDTLFFKKGENYKRYGNAEPRMTLTYLLNDKASIKTNLSRNVQNVHLISNSISPFTSLEVWLPSSINIKPQTSNQISVGYYQTVSRLGASFQVETFYKKMSHQIDYEAHAETLLNPLLEGELRFGTAKAYGIEFQLKKDVGRLRGSAGYSYARAKRKFAEVNQGRSFNAFYDRPHQINLLASYDLSLKWNLGMNWNYSTGAPFSSPVSFYSYNGQEVPVYGQKNNDRLPAYHRLDVSATLKLNKNPENKFHHSLTFSVFNFYGRKNALYVNYNKAEVADGSIKIPSDLLDANRITSRFYLFGFTPSIAYNFRWL
jgi:hypothetical protein